MYKGRCGPGTLVMTAEALVENMSSTCFCSGRGRKPTAPRIPIEIIAWYELFNSSIRRLTSNSRTNGFSMPTGRVSSTRPKWLPSLCS